MPEEKKRRVTYYFTYLMIIHSPHSDASATASTMSDDVASTVMLSGRRYPHAHNRYVVEILR